MDRIYLDCHCYFLSFLTITTIQVLFLHQSYSYPLSPRVFHFHTYEFPLINTQQYKTKVCSVYLFYLLCIKISNWKASFLCSFKSLLEQIYNRKLISQSSFFFPLCSSFLFSIGDIHVHTPYTMSLTLEISIPLKIMILVALLN